MLVLSVVVSTIFLLMLIADLSHKCCSLSFPSCSGSGRCCKSFGANCYYYSINRTKCSPLPLPGVLGEKQQCLSCAFVACVRVLSVFCAFAAKPMHVNFYTFRRDGAGSAKRRGRNHRDFLERIYYYCCADISGNSSRPRPVISHHELSYYCCTTGCLSIARNS